MTVARDAVLESAQFGAVTPFSFDITPVGTVRAVTVEIAQEISSSDLITGVTCEGVTMDRVDFAVDTGGEPGAAYTYFLGDSIPAGVLTIEITHTVVGGIDKWAIAKTYTAAADCEIVTFGKLQAAQANPQIALDTGATSSIRSAIFWGGHDAPSSYVVLTGMQAFTAAVSHDFGVSTGGAGQQTTASTGSFTVGWTATSAALAMIAVAIQEVSGAVTGTIAVTQDHQTAAISGTVLNPITGTIGVTQQDQAGAFVGSLGISGTIASTQQDQTAAFTGSVMGGDWDCADWDPLDWATDCAPTGVLASIQDNQTAAFTGTVANPVSGTIGVTQQNQTAAFAGTTVSDGTLSSIQQDQTGVFTGTVANPVSGTIGVTQADQTGAFAGTVTSPAVTGTIGVTQQDQIAAFVGQSVSTAVTGTIVSTQQNQTMATAGVVAMAVVGTIGVIQQNQTGSFVGAVANPSEGLIVSVECSIGGPAVSCTITPAMIIAGSNVVITSHFENAEGEPADPITVSAVVQAPDGTQTTPTPASITVGEWTTTIPTDQSGFWFYEITGQGDDIDVVCVGSFCVQPSLVLV